MRNIINSRYLDLSEFVQSLPEQYDALRKSDVMRTGRNEVCRMDVCGRSIVIKSYNRFSCINRVVYGTLRRSKALRAYDNATHLREIGIDTPEPIAAIDMRRAGILRRSFYVYAYSDYDNLRTALAPYPARELEPLLDALADFILKLHTKGVLHHDLNIENILYRDCGNGHYHFQLIDINRMEFKRSLSTSVRLKNLMRLDCNPAAYLYLMERYARSQNLHVEQFQLRSVGLRLLDSLKHYYKRVLKGSIK